MSDGEPACGPLETLPGLDPAPEPRWTPEAHESALLTMYGRPTPWRRSGYNPKTRTIYTTRKDKAERRAVGDAWIDAGLPDFGDRPLRLRCEFIFERPKSHFRTGANAHLLKADAPRFPGQSYGDVDNLVKLLLDGLNEVAFHDDAQIVGFFGTDDFGKRWAEPGERECTIVDLRLA